MWWTLNASVDVNFYLINCNLECSGSLINENVASEKRVKNLRCVWISRSRHRDKKKRKFQRCSQERRKKCQKSGCPMAQRKGLKASTDLRSSHVLWMNRKLRALWRENIYDTTLLDTHTMTPERERKNPLKWQRKQQQQSWSLQNLYTHVPNFWARFPLIAFRFSLVFRGVAVNRLMYVKWRCRLCFDRCSSLVKQKKNQSKFRFLCARCIRVGELHVYELATQWTSSRRERDDCASDREAIKTFLHGGEREFESLAQICVLDSGHLINCKSRWKLFRVYGAENENVFERRDGEICNRTENFHLTRPTAPCWRWASDPTINYWR